MVSGILETSWLPCCMRNEPQIQKQIQKEYSTMGFFYEHDFSTTEAIYQETDLESFVEKHKDDPVIMEELTPKNWANIFASGMMSRKYLAFKAPEKEQNFYPIRSNYTRYEVLIKRS